MKRLELVERIVSCEQCELHKVGSGPVPFSGPKTNPNGIAILGEAPGKQEDKKGEPFIGPAGELLRDYLRSVGVTPERCYFVNTVSCWPDGTPSPRHVGACADLRAAQLEFAAPRWVLVLGKVALGALRPGLRIATARGKPFGEVGGPMCFASYHPAAALRNGQYAKDLLADMKKFMEIVREGWDWTKLEPICFECSSDDIVWFDPDGVAWCTHHAPSSYYERMAVLKADYEDASARLAG